MIAAQTLALIDRTMQADQGAAYRKLLEKYMPMAADVYRGEESPFRGHLGASILGRECAREIWYSFRWATRKSFDGRLLRLFNRGHMEEPRMLALLEMIGCQVWSVNGSGKQFKVKGTFGHAGGSLDAVVKGIPECPTIPLLGEFKTHGDKSFTKLKEEHVLRAKWDHFIQMQYYMGKQDLRGALYMAVNKNTDELYAELVAFDPTQYARAQSRAELIIGSATPPARISKNPTWFKCKFCDHKEVCHGNAAPEPTCRSCSNSYMEQDGVWACKLFRASLPHEIQEKGCEHYAPMIEFKL